MGGWLESAGWMRTLKKAVKNDDLWRRLDELATQHRIAWHWLRGHAGHAENERCDTLARIEIERIRTQFTTAQLRHWSSNSKPNARRRRSSQHFSVSMTRIINSEVLPIHATSIGSVQQSGNEKDFA